MNADALIPSRPRPVLFPGLALAWAAGIFALSALPGSALPRSGLVSDVLYNLAHAPLYFGFGALVAFSLLVPGEPEGIALPIRRAHGAALIAFGYAVLDEVHQSFVKGRSPDGLDLVTDLSAIVLAVWLVRRRTRGDRPWVVPAMALLVLVALASSFLAARPFDHGARS